MKSNLAGFTLRINRIWLNKLQYVAKYELRSINKEIQQLIKKHVRDFEEEHGEIKLENTQ